LAYGEYRSCPVKNYAPAQGALPGIVVTVPLLRKPGRINVIFAIDIVALPKATNKRCGNDQKTYQAEKKQNSLIFTSKTHSDLYQLN
jgi:hypothetical protein